MVGERLHDFAVHKIQNHRPLINQRHFRAHRCHERSVLQAHHTRAHHDDFPRQTANAGELVRINNPLAVERDIGAARGARAAGDQYVFAAQCHFFALAVHFD